jgi:hypothetical protein
LQFAFFVGFEFLDGEGGDGTTRWMDSREDVRVVAFVNGLVDSAIRSTADEADDIVVVIDMPVGRIRGIIHLGEWRRVWSLW